MAIIVAITGASGSGKTTLAEKLKQSLMKQTQTSKFCVEIISMDDYYKCQDALPMDQRELTNYDHPDAFDIELLVSQLETIKTKRSINKPSYDFTVHTRHSNTTPFPKVDLCIVEGILPISSVSLQACYDLTFYLDVPLDTCLERRRNRDINERGRTIESVEAQFNQTVIPGFKQYIVKQKPNADVILTGEESVDELALRILS